MLSGDLQDICEGAKIKIPGIFRLFLPDRRHDRGHVIDRADVVLLNDRADFIDICAIQNLENAAFRHGAHGPETDARGNDCLGPIFLSKSGHQFRTDLSQRACN